MFCWNIIQTIQSNHEPDVPVKNIKLIDVLNAVHNGVHDCCRFMNTKIIRLKKANRAPVLVFKIH